MLLEYQRLSVQGKLYGKSFMCTKLSDVLSDTNITTMMYYYDNWVNYYVFAKPHTHGVVCRQYLFFVCLFCFVLYLSRKQLCILNKCSTEASKFCLISSDHWNTCRLWAHLNSCFAEVLTGFMDILEHQNLFQSSIFCLEEGQVLDMQLMKVFCCL